MEEIKRQQVSRMLGELVDHIQEATSSAHALNMIVNQAFIKDAHDDEARRIELEHTERYRKEVHRLLRCINFLAGNLSQEVGGTVKQDLQRIADLTNPAISLESVIRAEPRLARIWDEDHD